ncbi:MAG TPA: TonB-dependent receptor, partial [Rhodanobacteraceae bacterium]|nr:TonB-dependent receptor [Rhodanobacteraceae bacterium]
MSTKHRIQHSVLYRAMTVALLVAGAAPLLAASAQAQTPAASAQAAAVAVDIPAQALRTALDQFALQADMQVVYAGADIVRDLRAPAVQGTLTPTEILDRLLAGSGLRYDFVNPHTVSIHRNQAAQKGASKAAAPVASGDSAIAIHITDERVAAAKNLQVVTVTGTNLSSVDPASPLIMIDAAEIERGGYASIEEVLRHLPQNFSSRTSTSAAMGEMEYGDSYLPNSPIGNTAVNLRGLGSRSTLVLVNGHRLAGSAQGRGAFTDISSIPLSQVERIEVLTDGASAIYGADAVAGVVNIVLKKNYSGTQVELRHENSSSGADASR